MSAVTESQAEQEPGWLPDLFAAIDAMDTEAFAGFLTENGRFRFGSSPAVRGRDAIAAAVGAFYETIAGLRHEPGTVSVRGSTLFCEGEVTYTRHDGSQITLPFANVFELEDGLIADYKIYADIAPLYAA